MWGLGTGLEILWYTLAAITVAIFLYGLWRPVARYRRGRREGLPPVRELPARIRAAFGTIASQRTLRRRDRYAGWSHAAMFYGFLTLLAGTTILGIQTDLTEPIFGWTFFHGTFYLVYSLCLDLLGLALLVGLVMMMVRRGIIQPRKLDYERPDRAPDDPQYDRRVYSAGDWSFLVVLVVLVLTGYLLEGVRVAMEQPGYSVFAPIGAVVGAAIGGLGASEATLAAFRHGLWWFHGLVALAFVATIPYTKAFHMLGDVASLVLRDPLAGKRQRPAPPPGEGEPIGYGALADMRIVHLLQVDACTKCGRCHEACPANAVGRPLSPRDVVLELHEQANAAAGAGVGDVLGSLLHGPGEDAYKQPIIGHDGVREETVWACFQCNACVEICPVGIEQAPIINEMRRHLVDQGALDPLLQSTLQKVHKSGNSFGENKRKRGRWTRELDFEVKDARKEEVELLWFVGDYASFDPRSQRVTAALARLLKEAGVDFGILYDGERNAGNDVRRVGEEGLFELLAAENIASLEKCSFGRIMTTDPHSLNTLRNEYPQYGGSWEVVHHTALLRELLGRGALAPRESLDRRVTFHDPCFLGRHNNGYDAPREILAALGCELVEMPRNRDNSFCCGAGGGQIWTPDVPGAERPSESRIQEAVALGDLDYFVVCCPKDVTMYEDAIKTSGHAGEIELREIVELVAAATFPEPAAASALA
jgi:Fe-S oxidoreductase